MGCLDEGQILDLIEGRLSAEDEAEVKRHMGACDACRELVAETTRSIVGEDYAGPLSRGNTIGRYVIIDVVGAGGMGVVYAAYDPELDRKVAVKLLRRDVSISPTASLGELGKRLLREAQAMAKLSHPNVVSVYDAGSTSEAQVFVAMEFIQGTSLGAWLKSDKRSWRQVLDVYTKAGQGLAAAHAAGLVHRDFKPENVMVGTDGRVLVTDFGLARPVGRGQDSGSIALAVGRRPNDDALTEAGAIAGTPAYMSPEQLQGKSANVLTDQFSFCVALYQGLYGERPFAGASFEELEKEVSRGRVRDIPKDTQVPTRIRAALLKGLSVAPEARYESMAELLPAMQPRRFRVRRRVITLIGVVSVVLAGLLGYRGARRERLLCTGADRKLAGVWDGQRKAQIAAAFARSGRAYSNDAWRGAERVLDGYAHAWIAMRTDACEATRLRGEQSEEMLDRRVECLDSHLSQVTALTRLFSEADGDVVSRAVEASLALPNLEDCANLAALKAGVRPPNDPAKVERVQNARIHLARVKALDDAGKYDEARLLVEPIVGDARDIAYLPLEAEALALDGRVSGRLEDTRRAEHALREAAEAALASGHDAIAARAFIDLVYFVGHKAARYDDAHQWARYAAIAIERLGGNDELEADRLETFSIILWKQGKHEEALAKLERALSLYQRVFGPDHVKVAHTLDGIATVYFDLGKLQESYELDEKALAIAERALGPNHPQLSMYLNNMGNELSFEGRYADALAALRRALDIAEQTVGHDHPDTIAPLDSIGAVLTWMGKYEDALVYLARAKAIVEKAGRKGTPDYASVLNDIGSVELARGRAEAALLNHTEALAVIEKVLGKGHPDCASTLFRVADAHLALGKNREAYDENARALAIAEKALGPDSLIAAQILVGLGRAQMRLGSPRSAVAPLERAVQIREAHRGDPRDLADARFALGQALWATGSERDRARRLAREAREAFERPAWFKDRLLAVDSWMAEIDGRVTRRPN